MATRDGTNKLQVADGTKSEPASRMTPRPNSEDQWGDVFR